MEEKLLECPMLNKAGQLQILIKTGNRPHLVNKSDASQSLPAGTVIAAFGKGRFKRVMPNAPAEGDDARKEIKYHLERPEQLLLHNGTLCALSEVVEAKRKSGQPGTKLAYHEMVDDPQPSQPGSFTLKQTHDVRFVPQPAAEVKTETEGGASGSSGQQASQTSLATLLPPQAWKSSLT